MKEIDPAALLAAIRAAYGLPVLRAVPGPSGEVATCYILHDSGGRRYFLKCWSASRQGRWVTARLPYYLPLTRRLYEQGLFRDLPYPIPTQTGALWIGWAAWTLALFPFLPGRPLPYDAPWADSVYDALGRAVATIHRATPAVADLLPPRETLDIPFEVELRAALAEIEQVGARDTPGRQELWELVLPQWEVIAVLLDRLHDLQPLVRARGGPGVLCHTDIHGGNLLHTASGRLYILDWESVTVAPPEHDVQAFIGPGLARCLRAYRAAAGVTPLHVEQFAFYLVRRYLADLTDWMLRILYENTSLLQDAHDLAGIAGECIAKWQIVDQTLEGIAVVLHELEYRQPNPTRNRQHA